MATMYVILVLVIDVVSNKMNEVFSKAYWPYYFYLKCVFICSTITPRVGFAEI